MKESYSERIAAELQITTRQVSEVGELLSADATVPFIARYRKEVTGSLDEVQITAIRDRLQQLAELDKRRDAIIKSLTERELLTAELGSAIAAAGTLSALEDIYLPFRPKRRTRATIAREKGLEPLADIILAQEKGIDPAREAVAFIDAEKGVASAADALSGARDIIAETVNEDADARRAIRNLFEKQGVISSTMVKGKEKEGAKFRDYFDWREPVIKSPSHRLLAMLRGEKEGILNLSIRPPEEVALTELRTRFVTSSSSSSEQVRLAVDDCYQRLLAPSMENEICREAKKRADEEAIRVFAENLRELLMASPLGQKAVLGIDPGFRTGCKVVVLDAQGKLLHDTVIYPSQSQSRLTEAGQTVMALCDKYGIEAIAIGNGTAGRETEAFVRGLDLPASVLVLMVNESGASVYSASEAAREEFPDKDLTVRGAVSIGRRLMDPLAELVKIDAKSIGVGQYQHDVDQAELKKSLDDSVISCVNAVGVEANTASKQLLTYVSGLGPKLAENVVRYREENGPFKSRSELKKVPRLGAKAFEQAAGFVRIRGGRNPLDASAVHPESYKTVDRMVKDLGCSVKELMQSSELRARIDLERYVTDKVGLPTLNDIMAELSRPGRDPREKFEAFSFTDGVNKISDLKPGMKLPGIVTNVTNFGAFVDVGVHQDGLVHISQLADSFVKDPAAIVKVQQKVQVTVMEVDEERNRISLSMRANPEKKQSRPARKTEQKPAADERSRKRPARREAKPAPENNWLKSALKKP